MTDLTNFIHAFKTQMVIVTDDPSREGEGDLIIHASNITPEIMTFIINQTSGIVCVAMSQSYADDLDLPLMVQKNQDNHRTAFTVTFDSIDTSTGVSAHDRTNTVRAMLSKDPTRLRRPGHISGLIGKNGGLRVRRGHTEASLDLCYLNDLTPLAVICELKNTDGSMKSITQCQKFAQEHNIPIASVSKIVEHLQPQLQLEDWPQVHLARSGSDKIWRMAALFDPYLECYHAVAIYGSKFEQVILTRMHSECLTGDIFCSMHCDCGEQLTASIKLIEAAGAGMVFYLRQHEGRGIGLEAKLKSYKLQAEGYSTFEANRELGFQDDQRDYRGVIEILKSQGWYNLRLITDNPDKIEALKSFVVSTVPLNIPPNDINRRYLEAKRIKHQTSLLYEGDCQHSVPGLIATPVPTDPTELTCKADSLELTCKADPKYQIFDDDDITGVFANASIAIIRTRWWSEYIDVYCNNLIERFAELKHFDVKIVTVDGCGEIPFACTKIDADCIIVIGMLIEGATDHYHSVLNSLNTLTQISIARSIPIINGVIACKDPKLASERIGKNSINVRNLPCTALRQMML